MDIEPPDDLIARLEEIAFESRRLGPLPLAVPIVRRLRVREIVEAHLPSTPGATASHGLVLEALLLCCLQHLGNPRRPVDLDDLAAWVERAGLPVFYGVEARHFADERAIEALEALHAVRGEVVADVARAAVQGYVPRPEVVFHGFTSIVLGQALESRWGDFWDDEAEEDVLSFGLASVGREGLPLLAAAGDAEGPEEPLLKQARQLQVLLPGRDLVWLSSRASLTTHQTMEGLLRLGQHFLLAARNTREERARAGAISERRFRHFRPSPEGEAWRVADVDWTVPPRRGKGGEPLRVRAIIVQPSRRRSTRWVLLTDLRERPMARLLGLWRRKGVVEARNRNICTRLEVGPAWLERRECREALGQIVLLSVLVARVLESLVEDGLSRLATRKGPHRPVARREPWLDRVGLGPVTARQLDSLFGSYGMARFLVPGRAGPWKPYELGRDQRQALQVLGLPEPEEALVLLAREEPGD